MIFNWVLCEIFHQSALFVKILYGLLQFGIILEDIIDTTVAILSILIFVEAQQIAVGIREIALMAQPHV